MELVLLLVLGAVVASVLVVMELVLQARWRQRSWWLSWLGIASVLAVVAYEALHHIELRKLVGALLMPVGLLWLGQLAFVARLWRRGLRGPFGIAATLTLLYTLAGNTWLGGKLMSSLERGLPKEPPTGSFDAVFVLGGGTGVRPDGRPELTGGGDRLRVAFELYRQGQTKFLVTSGAAIPTLEGERDLASDTASLWEAWGVPADAIVKLSAPELVNTSAEVNAYREVIAKRSWTRVGLVTSAWHLRRALRHCRQQGLEMTPVPSDWAMVPQATWFDLVPQGNGFAAVQVALWEYLGAWVG
jgi:uncharacterized SAM-binding protein YcdF (DUF218 family)